MMYFFFQNKLLRNSYNFNSTSFKCNSIGRPLSTCTFMEGKKVVYFLPTFSIYTLYFVYKISMSFKINVAVKTQKIVWLFNYVQLALQRYYD